MARQIIENVLCDVCLHEDETFVEAGEIPPVTVGNAKPRVLALCERHRKELWEPFQSVLMELGQVDPRAAATRSAARSAPTPRGFKVSGGEHFCPDPECPKHTDGFKWPQGLRSHAEKHHETTLTALRAKFDPSFVPPSAPGGEHESVACPECEKPFPAEEYKVPQRALGVHRAKTHGVQGRAKARQNAA